MRVYVWGQPCMSRTRKVSILIISVQLSTPTDRVSPPVRIVVGVSGITVPRNAVLHDGPETGVG